MHLQHEKCCSELIPAGKLFRFGLRGFGDSLVQSLKPVAPSDCPREGLGPVLQYSGF